ncbi:hypothetical protein PINS_up021295 [Pythium insidiosum]|nr:hypothetical protein PINS_up021295 [Pythium insidiosum]
MAGASQILTIDELRSQNEWVPVAKRDNCVMCGGKFGTFRRKHHCRVCGDIMCSTCTLKRRALLPFIGMCKVKVCVRCASGTAHVRRTTHRGRLRRRDGDPRRRHGFGLHVG